MDEFKKYLQENRTALDLDEPGPQSWEKVQARLQQGRPAAKVVTIKKYFQWSVAACVFVLAGIGLWSLLDSKPETLQQQVLSVPNESAPNENASAGVENKSDSPANVATESGSNTVTDNGNEVLRSDRNIVNTANHSSNENNKTFVNRSNKSGSQGLSKDVLASLASVENGFTQVINLQRGKISTTPMYAESAAYFNEFKMQIQQIESDEKKLKKERNRQKQG